MELELLKALPGGGSLAVCIVLVILFLKHIRDSQEKFNVDNASMREAFQTQIGRLSDQVVEVVKNTSVALRGLEDAVRDLQSKIHN